MTTRGREVAVRGCLECSIDHHHACPAAYAQELRRRGLESTRRWPRPAEGERLMGQQSPLGPSRRCLHADHCEAGSATRQLGVATYQTPVGVFCATRCDPCVAAGNPPPMRSWPGAVERVGASCQHLGIDVDQMAALLDREREGGGDGQG